MAEVVLDGVAKRYGQTVALKTMNLVINEGEFLTLLGPSGCGKTTTLRLIAGFISPSEGRILIGGEDVTSLAPQERRIGMVFQDYALFPHLTIFENVAFGLVERRVKKREIEQRVRELLNLIQLPGAENRYPAEISGGQQQRVAVARAVAYPPRVLLMDEPLGALDLKLRQSMQLELRRIQQALHITTVYVTHDQTEAMTMSDRIAVMSQGEIEQLASATQIYRRPKTRFVADFVGKINLIEGQLVGRTGPHAVIAVAEQTLLAPHEDGVPAQGIVTLAVRPEHINLGAKASGGAGYNELAGIVNTKVFAGSQWNVAVNLTAGPTWTVEMDDHAEAAEPGMPVVLSWPQGRGILLTH